MRGMISSDVEEVIVLFKILNKIKLLKKDNQF